jgi:hypothetical protein
MPVQLPIIASKKTESILSKLSKFQSVSKICQFEEIHKQSNTSYVSRSSGIAGKAYIYEHLQSVTVKDYLLRQSFSKI